MSGLVYPANLPGLTFDSTRTPNFNTGVQAALSTKESRIAYQQYPQMMFELQYELLRDYVTPSDLKALVGLFMAVGGRFDTFLYSDPVFNTVANMQFGVTDGVTLSFQTTATYQNAAGPGGAEIIQNFNGTPVYYLNRYGLLNELLSPVARTQAMLQSQTFSNASWSKLNLTVATSATTAPDGTSTASNLVDSTATSVQHFIAQSISVSSGIQPLIFSGFIFNAGVTECGYITLALQENTGSTFATLIINLVTGAISNIFTGANWSGVSGTYVSLGNGWFRFSITAMKTNASTSINLSLTPQQTAFSNTYAGTNGAVAAIIWGFQIEANTQPTLYLPTTTVAVTQQDYTLGATGIIATTATLAAGGKLNWSGSFFYRVRFDDDSMTVSQFMANFWENKSVKLKQIKL